MASVSSLDKDMRNIRLSKYTPQAANEVRAWIEGALGERLASGDLLEALKDGIALCKLVNLAAPPGVRFKESSMPFVQMENISHFLRASQQPPLSLQSHDIFQTVDLYESKDPAQVLQCISAFSRKAHAAQPSKFPTVIGEAGKPGVVSPQSTGGFSGGTSRYGRPRGSSNHSETSATSSQASQAIAGRGSPSRLSETSSSKQVNGSSTSSGGVSSWSKKTDEGATIPAWNIHQYGYMGGASQGNQGISFGGRRQITTPAPKVPSLAEKERKRREQEAEEERLQRQVEEAEHKRRIEREAEEERERIAEGQRWEEETKRQREKERLRVEEEKRRWDEEERRWKQEEETRLREEREAEAKLEKERQQKSSGTDSRPKLQGQYLSQYKAEQRQTPMKSGGSDPARTAEQDRVRELERQLAEAKEREAQYERERKERLEADQARDRLRQQSQDNRSRSRSRPAPPLSQNSNEDSWQVNERDYLRQEWSKHNAEPQPPPQPPRPLPTVEDQAPPKPPRPDAAEPPPPQQPPRPLPTPQTTTQQPTPPKAPSPTPSPPPPITSIPPRPLPNPATYTSASPLPQRRSPFDRPCSPAVTQAFTPPPQPQPPSSNKNPTPRTQTTKKPPFANPSSLLSREMELDRQRQQEWEEGQKATQEAAARGVKEGGVNPGDGSWDTSQYGYLGGDSQNRGGTGIGFGGRRQLVGPREQRGK
ncbi:calponin [Lecanora helva]